MRAPKDWWLRDIVPEIVVGDVYCKGRPRVDGNLSHRWERPGRFRVELSLWPLESHVQCTSFVTVDDVVVGKENFTVSVSSTSVTYGRRLWLQCCACERRVRRLYLASSLVLVCATCAGITYASKSQSKPIRHLHRSFAIREALGGQPQLGAPLPPKPPDMQWKTYDQWCGKVAACEAVYEDELRRSRAKAEGTGARGTLRRNQMPEMASDAGYAGVRQVLIEALQAEERDTRSP